MKEKPLQILLVEDNAGDARLLREMFSTERPDSFKLTHLLRMSEAVIHLAKGGVDIILLDMGLPDGHGLDTVRRAHAAAPEVPLIVLTGLDDETLAAEAMKEGAQDYLIKGQIENRALPRALRHAIERHRMQTETDLIRKNQMQFRDEFLTHVSHELRSPLTAIFQFVTILLDSLGGELNPEQHGYLEIVLRNVRQLQSMIDDLVEVTRVQTGKLMIDVQRTSVAERQQAQAELSTSHAEAEQLLSSISSILIGVDDHGRITRWNAAAAATFAIPSAAALDRPLDDLGIHWHAPGVGERMAAIAALGKSLRLDDLEFRDAAGKDRSLGATIHPIRGEQGQHRGYVFLGVEISQRKQLQEQLRQAQKLEAIGQLAAGVAHEINTPTQYVGDNIRFLEESWKKLNPLLGLIGRLSQPAEGIAHSRELAAELHAAAVEAEIDYLVQEVPKALAQSLDGVERVSQIVKAMREFSHRGSLEKESADLNRAIEAAITVSRNEWKYVADVKTDLDPALPLVQCVIGQLQQVILNLLINAAHAIGEKIGPDSQQKGVIHVTTRLVPDAVEIRIEDTGTGIPEELRSRVFEPFFTTKPVGKGTGQGLALVHSLIVKGHSGKIWIESPPGKGAAFVIQLPLETPLGTERAAPDREPTLVPK